MSKHDDEETSSRSRGPRISRRLVLRGIGGAVMTLPFLEGFSPGPAAAAGADVDPFAIFFRQACGVGQAQRNVELGSEPDRFWPRTVGRLSADSVQGRAVGELGAYLDRLLVVGNVNLRNFPYGDGHAQGALQGLTAQGPVVAGLGGESEAAGESLDHRIGAELNPGGRESLFMYSGLRGGFLGGPCISYRGPGNRRSALHNPWNAYQALVGGVGGESMTPEVEMYVAQRQMSVNDLVRGQMNRLLSRPQLSSADRRRLELHRDSIRDIEVALTCQMTADQERALEGMSTGYSSTNGDEVLGAARLHMDIATLAIACGMTRSVAIQIGPGNDGSTAYRNPVSGELMENYHYISHRRVSHGSSGAIIPNSDLLHHYVDLNFARTFLHLLDRLDAYEVPGGRLLDCGIACWYNDNANGPGHAVANVPWVIAGSAGGFLRQGQFVEIAGGDPAPNQAQLLNTLGSAVGLRKADGGFLDDFGDPSGPRGVLSELMS